MPRPDLLNERGAIVTRATLLWLAQVVAVLAFVYLSVLCIGFACEAVRVL